MFESFNAGDFPSLFVAPLIASRPANASGSNAQGGLAVVGSILGLNPKYSWGPGFIKAHTPLNDGVRKIFALRGPVSYRQAMATSAHPDAISKRVDKVYGDVGSLMSWFYQPHTSTRIYDLCLLPHYIDAGAHIVHLTHSKVNNSRILKIESPLFHLMDEMVRCKVILSSSLHGLIFADSYGIPNGHMILSDKVYGGKHKFQDYFESANRKLETLTKPVSYHQVESFSQQVLSEYEIPKMSRVPFWEHCPLHRSDRSQKQRTQFATRFVQVFHKELQNRGRLGNFKARLNDQLSV